MSDPNLPQNRSALPLTESALSSPTANTAPTMTTAETLTNIFFEPGRTFEALRERPRFLIAALIFIVLFMVFYVLFMQRVGGYETIARARIEASQPDMDPARRDEIIAQQSSPVFKVIGYIAPPIFLVVFFAAGAGLYLLGAMLMGRGMSYKQSLAVWTYSSFPPMVLTTVINILVLFLKSPENIDPIKDSQGLVQANPGAFVDATANPVLATALSAFDLFAIFGLFLAALGLQKVARLSSGAAWGVALGIYLIGVVLRIAMAAAFGTMS